MNEKLKFSWAHIIAALALIFITYVSFMGLAYRTGGISNETFVATAVILIVLVVVFIGAQRLKGTSRRFKKRIRWERFLVFTSPIVFAVLMIPSCHFWTVLSQKKSVEKCFSGAIESSKQVFTDYERYVDTRWETYRVFLNRTSLEDYQKENRLNALRLQLKSENYTQIKDNAIQWIEDATDGGTVWNVFLLGNIRQIRTAIRNWHSQLVDMSRHKMAEEPFAVSFDESRSSLAEAENRLTQVQNLFTIRLGLHPLAFLFGILSYLMLLLPYLVQTRHTKSTLHLWWWKKEKGNYIVEVQRPMKTAEKLEQEEESGQAGGNDRVSGKKDNYEPFTL